MAPSQLGRPEPIEGLQQEFEHCQKKPVPIKRLEFDGGTLYRGAGEAEDVINWKHSVKTGGS
jgi:hypothetical protein